VQATRALAQRNIQPEIMDQPGLDGEEHRSALRGLARINWISDSVRILLEPLLAFRDEKNAAPLRALDVACGGGDVAIALQRRARRAGLDVEVHGCDLSEEAIAFARRRAKANGSGASFFRHDALAGRFPEGYDVILSSLFFHHLERSQAEQVLTEMARAAKRMIVVNDLRRCTLGYAAAWAGCRALSASPIVHHDGPRSVEAAFTDHEFANLAQSCGLEGFAIARRWPFRFRFVWAKP
jgi:SAM-dependent methyltransferase